MCSVKVRRVFGSSSAPEAELALRCGGRSQVGLWRTFALRLASLSVLELTHTLTHTHYSHEYNGCRRRASSLPPSLAHLARALCLPSRANGVIEILRQPIHSLVPRVTDQSTRVDSLHRTADTSGSSGLSASPRSASQPPSSRSTRARTPATSGTAYSSRTSLLGLGT